MYVNIIIPLYNSNYIEKQLLSIKKLQNKAIFLDIILIDDGSNDYYRKLYKKIINNYSDINISYHYLGEKKGENRVCLARNIGAKLAKSENLVFIDQETILPSNYLSNLEKHISTKNVIIGPYFGYNNLEKTITLSDVDYYIKNGNINKKNFNDFRTNFYKEKQKKNKIWEFFCASNFFIKKFIYESVGGFDETLNTWGDEDTEFAYRLQKSGQTIIFDENLTVLNLSEKLYNKPFNTILGKDIESLSNNWIKNYKKHKDTMYKSYVLDRYNHLDNNLKTKVSNEFKIYFLNKKNILIHAINGIGLGHIKRTLLIAKELSKLDDIGDIVFVSNSKNPFLIEDAGFRVFSLDYGIEDCIKNISFKTYEKNSFKTINNIINKNNIDIIVHDTYFIKSLLTYRKDLSHFLVLRDSELDYLETIKSYLYSFKKIYIPHIKQELNLEKQDFYKEFKNIIYSGYVFEDLDENIRKEKKMIVSAAYGGDYENTKFFFEYINNLISKNISKFKDFEIEFFLGKHFEELKARIDFPDFINISQFDNNLSKTIKNCEIFIGRGGYNTINEVYFTYTKSLLFSVERNAEKQDSRIDFFINNLGADFIKKGSYDERKDEESLEELIEKPLSGILSPYQEKEATNTIKLLDGKINISDEIIKNISKKNILVFKHIFLPKSENFIYEELRLLEKVNPIIFTLKKENLDIFPNSFNLYYKEEFEELLNFDYPKIKNKELYIKLLKYIVFLIKRHDIKIIYTEFLFDAYFIHKIKSILPDIKIISAARGYDVYTFLKTQSQFLEKIDKVLVRDEEMKKKMTKYLTIPNLNPFPLTKGQGATDKVEIVRSVLDFSKYEFKKKSFDKLDILFGGRFVEKKGLLELLDLINMLSKQDFVGKIALFGDGELKENILKKISDLGLTEKVKYLGFLEHKDLIIKLNEYNCFVSYSKVGKSGDSEGIPNLISENILSGNLIFTTLVGGLNEVIIDGKTGVVLSGNVEVDFEKIKRILNNNYPYPESFPFSKRARGYNNNENIEKIVANGFEKVREEFGRDKGVGKLEEILQIMF